MAPNKIDVEELKCPKNDCCNLHCLLAFGTGKVFANKCIKNGYDKHIPYVREGGCATCEYSTWGEHGIWSCQSPVPKPWPTGHEAEVKCPGWAKRINTPNALYVGKVQTCEKK